MIKSVLALHTTHLMPPFTTLGVYHFLNSFFSPAMKNQLVV